MNPLVEWAKAREELRIKKESGAPPPWTDNPVLRQFRFTNVRREDDKVTKWIAGNWRTPNQDDPDLWFAMVVARHVNLPETMQELGYPVPWKPAKFIKVVRGRKARGLTAYNAAYMIRAGKGGNDKAQYLAEKVFGPLWKKRKKLRPVVGETLENYHTRLAQEFGLGSFISGQVLSDLAYVEPLRNASDWEDFAASGPGSRRGLNRLLGRPLKAPWKESLWREEFRKFREQLKPEFEAAGVVWSHARDFQNALCETDKYLRFLSGDGRPKQKYKGGELSVFNV